MGRPRISLYVGCSGYFYWHWKGRFYPRNLEPSRWFAYYARHFNTVEINATFYRLPTPSKIRAWARQAPPGFVYALKLPREITHQKRFRDTKPLLKTFYHSVANLRPHLGPILVQLPPSMQYRPETLEGILRQLNRKFFNVLEFRHRSWWDPDVFATLERNRVGFVSVSAPRLPKTVQAIRGVVYVRFHGKKQWYRSSYDREELREWAERILSQHPRKIYLYFNNDAEGYAPQNALWMKEILHSLLDEKSTPP